MNVDLQGPIEALLALGGDPGSIQVSVVPRPGSPVAVTVTWNGLFEVYLRSGIEGIKGTDMTCRSDNHLRIEGDWEDVGQVDREVIALAWRHKARLIQRYWYPGDRDDARQGFGDGREGSVGEGSPDLIEEATDTGYWSWVWQPRGQRTLPPPRTSPLPCAQQPTRHCWEISLASYDD